MNLDPRSLQLFVRVLEKGTIAAAADGEYIAPAAVSKRISDLEALFGTPLLLRSNKGVQATEAGLMLVDLSRRLLNDIASVELRMREHAHGSSGQVRLFANISAISQFLPAALGAFTRAHPQVAIQLEERVSLDIARALLENAADVGMLVATQRLEGLEYHRYQQDDLAAVVPHGHALSRRTRIRAAQLFEHQLVGLHERSQMNLQLIRAAQDCAMNCRFRVQVTSYDALCHMVEAGLGVGVLPFRLAQSYRRAMKIKVLALDEAWAHRELSLCFRSYASLAPAPRLLVDHLLR